MWPVYIVFPVKMWPISMTTCTQHTVGSPSQKPARWQAGTLQVHYHPPLNHGTTGCHHLDDHKDQSDLWTPLHNVRSLHHCHCHTGPHQHHCGHCPCHDFLNVLLSHTHLSFCCGHCHLTDHHTYHCLPGHHSGFHSCFHNQSLPPP